MTRRTALATLLFLATSACPAPSATDDSDVDTGDPETGLTDDTDDTGDTDTDTGDTDPPPSCPNASVARSAVEDAESCALGGSSGPPARPTELWVSSTPPYAIELVASAVEDWDRSGTISRGDPTSVLVNQEGIDPRRLYSGIDGSVLGTVDATAWGYALLDIDGDLSVELAGTRHRYGAFVWSVADNIFLSEDWSYYSDSVHFSSSSPVYYADIGADGTTDTLVGAYAFAIDGSETAAARDSEDFSAAGMMSSDLDADGDIELFGGGRIHDAWLRRICRYTAERTEQTMAARLTESTDLQVFSVQQPMGSVLVVDRDCVELARFEPTPAERAGEGEVVQVRGARRAAGPALDATAPFEVFVEARIMHEGEAVEGLAAFSHELEVLWTRPGLGRRIVLADLDGNGTVEVITTSFVDKSLYALDGATGETLWHADDREYTWPIVLDVNHDGHANIVSATRRFDGEQGWVDELVALESSGEPWAPAQWWWNVARFHPATMKPDATLGPAVGHEHLALAGTHNAAFDPSALGGGHASPSVRVVDTCELECDRGRLVVEVQLGNVADQPLRLPAELVMTGRVEGGEPVELVREALPETLDAATWQASQLLVAEVDGPVSDVSVQIVPTGWEPFAVCDREALVVQVAGTFCE